MGVCYWTSPLIGLASFWVWMIDLLNREDLPWVCVTSTNGLVALME